MGSGMTWSWLMYPLGWTLLHFVWQGAIAALVVWCALALMERRSAQARYAMALLGLWAMVALPAVTFVRLSEQAYRLAAGRVGLVDAGALTVQVGADDAVSWSARLTAALDHALPWVMLVWCVGVVFFSCRLAVGIAVTRALKLQDTEEVSERLQTMFDALRSRLGANRMVRLVHSAKVHVPTVIGWLKPVVLLPVECLTGMSEEQIEALLAHELAHICRNDYLVSVFQQVVEALLFYHPAVWWISAQVRREREYCCDELAVGVCGDRLAYARALSLLEERRAMLPEVVLGANGGVLKMRIKRLLGCRDEVSSSQLAWAVLLAVAIAAGGAVVGKIAFAESRGSNAAGMQSPSASASQEQVPDTAAGVDADLVLEQAEQAERLADRAVRRAEELSRRLSTIGTTEHLMQDAQAKDASAWTAEDQKRLEDAQRRLQDAIQRLNSDRFRKQMEAARAQMEKLNSPEFRKQMEAAKEAAAKVNTPEFRKKLEDAQKKLANSQELQEKIQAKLNSPAFKKQVEDAQKQAEAAAAKMNSPEFRQKMQEMQKRIQEKVESPEFRKQMEDMRKQAEKFDSPEFKQKMQEMQKQAEKFNTPEFREKIRKMTEDAEKNGSNFKVNINPMFAQNSEPSPAPEANPAPAPAPRPDTPVHVSAAVVAKQVIKQVPPVYPAEAKEQRIQGTVVLRAIISKFGNVENLQVESGPKELAKSALDAVSQWKYKPILLNGQPVDVVTTINVNYSLAEDSKPSEAEPGPSASAEPTPKANAAPEPVRDSAGNPVRKIGGAVTAPMLVYKIDPQYTPEAKAAKVKGPVLLNLIVDEKGEPENVRVVRGLGHGLDQGAVNVVRQYRFKPAMEDGKAVPVLVNVEVDYQVR